MRTTCLYCEQRGVTTLLVQTVRGGCCPLCSGDFIEALSEQAKRTLGIPQLSLGGRRGIPHRK